MDKPIIGMFSSNELQIFPNFIVFPISKEKFEPEDLKGNEDFI